MKSNGPRRYSPNPGRKPEHAATLAGLPASTAVLPEGISVNVTLIFSVERHRAVMDAHLARLEAGKAADHDISKIHSVASFFVSRVDTDIDKRLEKIGTTEALALSGQAELDAAAGTHQGCRAGEIGWDSR